MGERTVDGMTVREAVRVAFMLAVLAIFARFFGLARSCDAGMEGAFSLSSSPAVIWSLYCISFDSTRHRPIAYLRLFRLFLGTSSSTASCRFSSALLCTRTGGAGFGFAFSACSSSNSWIFRFLNACGIRLTRISRRDRSPCACKAYCARSLRARSVTVQTRQ